ncbi:hypothetical protein TNCV_2686921 [Trichonephila clavipes]|nr:hypothetical protein TNCV_2686921 [Trichonephila clavipes]
MSFDKALWKAAFTGIASNTNAAIMVPEIEERSPRLFAVRGILYKGTLPRYPRCSRHRQNDEAGISTPVAVDQRAANCLEEAVWSFTPLRCRRR